MSKIKVLFHRLIIGAICSIGILSLFLLPTDASAASGARIHFLTLPDNTEAILLENNGHFGMVDSGEDSDYPDGSDPAYPKNPGIVTSAGFENDVISYLHSVGVTTDNFDFYIGTHPHSDHIGSADEIIREFHPKRVYIQEYDDSFISDPSRYYDNQYIYDQMIAAAKDVGATLIQNFDPDAPLYPETISISGTISWDDSDNSSGLRPDQVTLTLKDAQRNVLSYSTTASEKNGWSYTFYGLPKYDDSKDEIAYNVVPEDLSDSSYTLSGNGYDFIYHYVSSEESPDSVPGITDLPDAEASSYIIDEESPTSEEYTPSSDSMHTDSIPASDIVDPTVPDDPRNLEEYTRSQPLPAPSSKETGSTVSTPVFTLGETMTIEIMHYGLPSNTIPDANYISLGVKVTANGKTAFLSGDINNYDGAETALAAKLGHVNLLCLGHHGYYGSNTSGYINTLSPDMAILPGDFIPVSSEGNPSTLDTLLDLGKKGTPVYATALYHSIVPAIVVNMDSSLSTNLPAGTEFVAYAAYAQTVLHYRDGIPTPYKGFMDGYGQTAYFNNSIISVRNNWVQIKDSWYYCNSTGWVAKSSWIYDYGWFYLDDNGCMVKGWLKLNNVWYYLGANGQMVTGEQKISGNTYYFDDDGKMISSAWINGKYYGSDGKWIPNYKNQNWRQDAAGWWYIRSDGSYPRSQWELIDGIWYYFNGSGYMLTGWQYLGGSWYYLNEEGHMLTGWQQIGGSWYYLSGSGAMLTGWQLINGSWYYMNGSGVMLTGWQYLGGQWYYLSSSGHMLTGWQFINGSWYYLNGFGHMLVGWQFINNNWYYMNGSGAMLTGWQAINGTWYYMNSSGAMTTGWQEVGGLWYYMNNSGAMLTEWQLISGTWYYMNGSGAMLTGWQFISGQWYYMDPSGHMITGWRRIDGIWYYMNGSGHMLTGWQLINGTWYYMDRSGHMLTGWQLIGGTWYYMNSSGAMLTGWQYINGQWYYMNGSGAMLTGWQYINGQWYYMNGSGHMLTGTHTIGNTTYRFADSGAWIG